MDLLNGKIKNVYFKYLFAAFGSTLISSVYGIVDMAVVGQYQGPDGTAALSIVAPIWNIVFGLGLLIGIGGAVLFSDSKGKGDFKSTNEYFTTSLIGTAFFSLFCWLVINVYDRQMLLAFGANHTLSGLAESYLLPIKLSAPLFLINQVLASFLRNDNAPGLATAGVLIGGVMNIFGDIFFVFTLDMGIYGAGLATSLGALLTFAIMLIHFFTKKNTLKIVKLTAVIKKIRQIIIIGLPTFIVDVAMGILTILFNRQILKYLGTDALAVYGIIVTISTIVQCCAYSVGQASQPIISINFGARKVKRIKETLYYAIWSAFGFALIWTGLIFSIPDVLVKIFMTPTESINQIAPFILRSYGLSFILLPINIFSTFYFQSIMKPVVSLAISVARGILISGALIIILPRLIGANAIWYAMPITEVIVFIAVAFFIIKYTKALQNKD